VSHPHKTTSCSN